MEVVEMVFAREEENGIRGGLTCVTWWGEVGGRGGIRHSVQRLQPADSDPGTSAMSGWAWPLKTEEVGC
jgi:hypothetical protein